MTEHHPNHTRYWVDHARFNEDLNACFDIAFWQKKNAVVGSAKGRGTTWFVKTDFGEAALRHYRRGGLISQFNTDHYIFTGWERTRAAREFALLQYLRAQGLNVPHPLAARVIQRGVWYQADLIVEKIHNAKDLVARLKEKKLESAHYQTIGKLIAKMHQLQVHHHDLNIHNILMDAEDQFWLIDFDKCGKRDGKDWQAGNLARLHRSFCKEVTRANIQWHPTDWDALLQGYNASI